MDDKPSKCETSYDNKSVRKIPLRSLKQERASRSRSNKKPGPLQNIDEPQLAVKLEKLRAMEKEWKRLKQDLTERSQDPGDSGRNLSRLRNRNRFDISKPRSLSRSKPPEALFGRTPHGGILKDADNKIMKQLQQTQEKHSTPEKKLGKCNAFLNQTINCDNSRANSIKTQFSSARGEKSQTRDGGRRVEARKIACTHFNSKLARVAEQLNNDLKKARSAEETKTLKIALHNGTSSPARRSSNKRGDEGIRGKRNKKCMQITVRELRPGRESKRESDRGKVGEKIGHAETQREKLRKEERSLSAQARQAETRAKIVNVTLRSRNAHKKS